MDVFARLIKLKSGSGEKVRTWARTINERRPEALETLRSEGVDIESWFSLSLDGEDYLLVYMRSDSMAKAREVATVSEHPIDALHQNFKEDTWVRSEGVVASLLVDLTVEDNDDEG